MYIREKGGDGVHEKKKYKRNKNVMKKEKRGMCALRGEELKKRDNTNTAIKSKELRRGNKRRRTTEGFEENEKKKKEINVCSEEHK